MNYLDSIWASGQGLGLIQHWSHSWVISARSRMQVAFPSLFFWPLRSIPYHRSWYPLELVMESRDGWHGVLPILFFSQGWFHLVFIRGEWSSLWSLFCEMPLGLVLSLSLFNIYMSCWVRWSNGSEMSLVSWWHPALHLYPQTSEGYQVPITGTDGTVTVPSVTSRKHTIKWATKGKRGESGKNSSAAQPGYMFQKWKPVT